MDTENVAVEVDTDGIALITWDMAGRSMNVLTEPVVGELDAIVTQISDDDAIKGAVIASGKPAFCAGGDLSMMLGFAREHADASAAGDARAATATLMQRIAVFSRVLRRLETCGKPFAAAVTGTALGGGLEVALACHHRVVADDDAIKLGLPEATIGLLPGAGGTQRLPRLIGASEALALMLRGRPVAPGRAHELGFVDQLVAPDKVIDTAKAWLRETGDPVAAWDKERFRVPGGAPYSPTGMLTWTAANALYRKETYDNYPAQRAIMSCVYEGLTVPIDVGLRIEARHFTKLIMSPEAANMIRTLFLSKQALDKLVRRPADTPPSKVSKLGLLGAGMMGAGIAYVSARAGIDAVLIDRDTETAERGKALSANLMDDRIAKGRAGDGGQGGASGADPDRRRPCRARRLRSVDRGRLRGPRRQGRGHESRRAAPWR